MLMFSLYPLDVVCLYIILSFRLYTLTNIRGKGIKIFGENDIRGYIDREKFVVNLAC